MFLLGGLFVLECVAARALLGWPGSALIPWTAVITSYVFYRLAVPCAEKWYDWINAAFDLYRYDLAERLTLRPFKDEEDEMRMWWTISSLVKRGSLEESDRIFDYFLLRNMRGGTKCGDEE